MGKNLPIGERLSDERKRLGYNQSDFSALAGITRKTLFGYESGERAPDALALAAWAKSGLDVLYVVTGQRQGVPAPAPAQEQEAPLAPDERILLDNYRHSPPDAQAALKATSDAFAQRSKKKTG
ncbi:TPA: helix-turn-helix domain-containing protein [Pseudomonas aeruginosa]|jgi:transcriptional regulator with XRE-family HTH domain|uniref:Helix-turn-helix domain-containing protein n=3 Tax=Pseudomonas aeruginosa TaxID=287 RepID=A0A0G6E2W6_PSEAI|nr:MULTISPECIES: helix-turn-helix domain-containing protein [Pseudomonas]AYD80441.1 repressor [Pseudomonas phage Ps56]HDK9341474.1 helix-turn-helix domain-containing protein [Staphylococcus aureus]HEM7588540.1 helix-turn-helix domain-containing protein [Serratia marcescens]ASA18060.1 transcriptional regulator [Pseudomonas aeruginosa]AUA78486.1 helix-turn-helix domain-containing protein [Pseudomonas aeruginosa]